jgi:tetratricopeptide (TPR) repeat protein
MAEVSKKVDPKNAAEASSEEKPKLEPISAAKRKLLQRQFEEASKLSAKGNFDYADQLFKYCVGGDPGNLIYTQNLLNNLIRKYNNNKKGAKGAGIRGMGAKSAMSKARKKKEWVGAVKGGLDYLSLNPWETSVLIEIGNALAELDCHDCRLEYIKLALSTKPTDVELNKVAAAAFEDVGDFDSAIRCWERISQQLPNDQDVARTIGQLHVNKTIHKGGYEEAETSRDVKVPDKEIEQRGGGRGADDDVPPEVKLRREIKRKPEEVTTYISLSEYFWKQEKFEEAENVMHEAVKATKNNIRATEYLEDVQLGRLRRNLGLAQKKAAQDKSEKSLEMVKKLKVELNTRELEIYGGRCERYPGNFSFKYEFGLRLRLAGKYREAITQLQQARNEPKRIAEANLQLGVCFYKLQKLDLALSSFAAAVTTSDQWHTDTKKEALYHAGRLARDMKDNRAALGFFTELAGLEYGYRDVAELLESTRKRLDEE